jgi:hypothetical protein
MVRNGITRICIYFGSTERNSELCSLPEKGSEQNYGSLLLFMFHGAEFRVIFSSAEGFVTEFRVFLFRGTTGIPSEVTICSVYSIFRGIIFLSEIPNPTVIHDSLKTILAAIFCLYHRREGTNRLTMATFWRTSHHDGKFSPAWCGWGVARPPPFTTVYLPSGAHLWCALQLRGQIQSPK